MNPMTYYSSKIFMKQRFDISNVLENNIIMKIFDFIDFFSKNDIKFIKCKKAEKYKI